MRKIETEILKLNKYKIEQKIQKLKAETEN